MNGPALREQPATKRCLFTGAATSDYYVRASQSPGIMGVVKLPQNWPV